MDIKEYEILVDWCRITSDGKYMFFNPILDEDKKVIDEIIEKNKLTDLSLEKFQEIVSKHHALYQTQKKLNQKQLDTYLRMSTEQIAELPLEDKLNYIDLLFPHIQSNENFMNVTKDNKDKIKACMFNINFPKSFWDKEKRQVDRYVALIANSADMMNIVKNWENLSLDDKKQAVLKSAKVFKYVYGEVPEVVFFTPEEEKAERRQKGKNESAFIGAAYYSNEDKKIHFNLESLSERDNFFAISVMLHEGTHFRQDMQNFEDPLINRIFHSTIERVQIADKAEGKDAFDFYAMQPGEIHAHSLQEYAENILIQKTGIEKSQPKILTEKTKNIHNKAFSMAKISQYQSSK